MIFFDNFFHDITVLDKVHTVFSLNSADPTGVILIYYFNTYITGIVAAILICIGTIAIPSMIIPLLIALMLYR